MDESIIVGLLWTALIVGVALVILVGWLYYLGRNMDNLPELEQFRDEHAEPYKYPEDDSR